MSKSEIRIARDDSLCPRSEPTLPRNCPIDSLSRQCRGATSLPLGFPKGRWSFPDLLCEFLSEFVGFDGAGRRTVTDRHRILSFNATCNDRGNTLDRECLQAAWVHCCTAHCRSSQLCRHDSIEPYRAYDNSRRSWSHTPDQGTERNEPPRMESLRVTLCLTFVPDQDLGPGFSLC